MPEDEADIHSQYSQSQMTGRAGAIEEGIEREADPHILIDSHVEVS